MTKIKQKIKKDPLYKTHRTNGGGEIKIKIKIKPEAEKQKQ